MLIRIAVVLDGCGRVHQMRATVVHRHSALDLCHRLALDVGALPGWALHKFPILLAATSVFDVSHLAHRVPKLGRLASFPAHREFILQSRGGNGQGSIHTKLECGLHKWSVF